MPRVLAELSIYTIGLNLAAGNVQTRSGLPFERSNFYFSPVIYFAKN